MNILNRQGVKYISVAALTGGIIMAPKLLDGVKTIARYATAPDTAEAALQLATDTRYDFDKYLEIQEKIQQVQLETAQQMQQQYQRPRMIEWQDPETGEWWCSYDEVDWWKC